MDQPVPSRRQFLTAVGNLASASWVALNWPSIAAAAEPMQHGHHAMAMGDEAPPTAITTLAPSEAADVEAIASLIVPSGKTPGAREVGALLFIDNALGSFFKDQLAPFRKGLGEFQAGFAQQPGVTTPFARAPEAQQTAWLAQVEKTPFFLAVRRLTVLGLLALPKYGGNKNNMGWALIGVEDNHYWEPPFGYYDRDYPGFQPYPGTKPYTA
ncbi:gluconate 2-dehydrogenase subunit 3 family protein [Novosphingobium sp.]|uniref:gluconate 2-dehydrogenase subunit 3 family protein n=1 Tax=Novosphingobium sp. TaxID=1874826 RepID=UPI0026274DC3|nr:gluconate 2-dehydrogenase subunit 3 family protein [Novosphingobium sp.]